MLAKEINEFNIGIQFDRVKQYCDANKLIFLTYMKRISIYKSFGHNESEKTFLYSMLLSFWL